MNRQDDKISDVQQITEMVDALGNTTEVKGAAKKKVRQNNIYEYDTSSPVFLSFVPAVFVM